jgi:hypothetical protein
MKICSFNCDADVPLEIHRDVPPVTNGNLRKVTVTKINFCGAQPSTLIPQPNRVAPNRSYLQLSEPDVPVAPSFNFLCPSASVETQCNLGDSEANRAKPYRTEPNRTFNKKVFSSAAQPSAFNPQPSEQGTSGHLWTPGDTNIKRLFSRNRHQTAVNGTKRQQKSFSAVLRFKATQPSPKKETQMFLQIVSFVSPKCLHLSPKRHNEKERATMSHIFENSAFSIFDFFRPGCEADVRPRLGPDLSLALRFHPNYFLPLSL